MPKKSKKEKNFDETEIVYEDEVSGASSKLEKLKKEIKKLKAEKQEYLDGWQRAKAELINYKKRNDEDRKDILKYSSENIISQILPVLDSFDMAFRDKNSWEKVDANWRSGVEYIHSQLVKILEENGVTPINDLGKDFDPKRHNSTENVEVDNPKEDNRIVAVVMKGYEIGDKILRPSNVKVGVYKK